MRSISLPATALCLLLLDLAKRGLAIDCFKCMSVDGHDPDCEDQFGPENTTEHLLSRDCKVGYFDFKAFYCVKIKGIKKGTSQSLVIRECSVNDWGSQCGDILFEHDNPGSEEPRMEPITGCVESCSFDGCNSATSHLISSGWRRWTFSILILAYVWHIYAKCDSLIDSYAVIK